MIKTIAKGRKPEGAKKRPTPTAAAISEYLLTFSHPVKLSVCNIVGAIERDVRSIRTAAAQLSQLAPEEIIFDGETLQYKPATEKMAETVEQNTVPTPADVLQDKDELQEQDWGAAVYIEPEIAVVYPEEVIAANPADALQLDLFTGCPIQETPHPEMVTAAAERVKKPANANTEQTLNKPCASYAQDVHKPCVSYAQSAKSSSLREAMERLDATFTAAADTNISVHARTYAHEPRNNNNKLINNQLYNTTRDGYSIVHNEPQKTQNTADAETNSDATNTTATESRTDTSNGGRIIPERNGTNRERIATPQSANNSKTNSAISHLGNNAGQNTGSGNKPAIVRAKKPFNQAAAKRAEMEIRQIAPNAAASLVSKIGGLIGNGSLSEAEYETAIYQTKYNPKTVKNPGALLNFMFGKYFSEREWKRPSSHKQERN